MDSRTETERPRDSTHVLLVRLSPEVSTKARSTRLRFTKKLAHNLHRALTDLGAEFAIERQWSRLIVSTDHPQAAETAARVFGIHSVSSALAQRWHDFEDIIAAGEAHFRDAVADRKFAVRARRVDTAGKIPFRSTQIERELGSALIGGAAGVDLTRPEVTAYVELHPGRMFLFSDFTSAHGGLPLGIDSRALSLVSGGFDSAVASWKMLRRGVALQYLFFNLGGTIHHLGTTRVMQTVAKDWSYGYRPHLHIVDLRPAVDDMRRQIPGRYWQVVLKRLMVRGADRIASELGVPAIVMGDAIGQVSSQTLDNLAVISAGSERPILRPLIAANKQEIVDRAKEIGTYELSSAVGEFCALDAKNPTTKAALDDVVTFESRLDHGLLEKALAEREVFDLRSNSAIDPALSRLAVNQVPDGALVIDLRPKQAYDRWHYRGAVHIPYEHAIRRPEALPEAREVLFYCEVGLKSVHAAELLQKQGRDATYFEGGSADLQRLELGDDPLAAALRAPAAITD